MSKNRHKWDGKLDRKKVFATCLNCGCTKQRYYGLILYFTNEVKDPFLKAPNCPNTTKVAAYKRMRKDTETENKHTLIELLNKTYKTDSFNDQLIK